MNKQGCFHADEEKAPFLQLALTLLSLSQTVSTVDL